MSILSKLYFHNEEAAYAKLESIVWPNGPVCPHCGATDRIYGLKGKTARPGLRKCGHCRKQFTVKVGTVFESSHVPLFKWLQATYLMCASKKGISAHQLHRTLEVTYKTALFMENRLRVDYNDFGTIEGRLEAIQGKDRLKIGVNDPLFRQNVRCYMTEDLLALALSSFRKRVEVSGTIHYRRDGTPVSIDASSICALPDDSELPTANDVRGILSGLAN